MAVPDSLLAPCEELSGCNFCDYWTPQSMWYNAGVFLHMMTGVETSVFTFPGEQKHLNSSSWFIVPNIEAADVAFFRGFDAAPMQRIRAGFQPNGSSTWVLSAHTLCGSEGESMVDLECNGDSTVLLLDNELLLQSFLLKASESGTIAADDPQIRLAQANTWKWVLVPYQLLTIQTQPELEELPQFFINVTEWSNLAVEEQGEEQKFGAYFDLISGMAIAGELVDNLEFVNYTVFQNYVHNFDRTSPRYPYLNCLNQILLLNLAGTTRSANWDQSINFTVVNFPHGFPRECTREFYNISSVFSSRFV
jgi:hypothetical protein